MSRCGFLVLLVFLGLGRGVVLAGGLKNFADSWPISPSTARRLLQDRTQEASTPHSLLVMVGQGRLFEMSELNQRFLALEGSFPSKNFSLNVAGQWERTGSGLFVEDHLVGRILLGKNSCWGVKTHWIRQTLAGRSEDAVLEFGLLWELDFVYRQISGRFHLEWPLNHPAGFKSMNRRRNIFKITIIALDLATALVVDRHDDGTPKPGFHLLLALDRGVGLELRADPATGSLGPGLSLVHGGLMLRTSHLIHPHLGVTHRLQLVVGKFGGEG